MLDRGPFREYALPFFRLVSSCRSLGVASRFASPFGQLVHRKVFPTGLLSWDLRFGESNERGWVAVAVAVKEASFEKDGIPAAIPRETGYVSSAWTGNPR